MEFQIFIHMLEMNLVLGMIIVVVIAFWNSAPAETPLATVSWNG